MVEEDRKMLILWTYNKRKWGTAIADARIDEW